MNDVHVTAKKGWVDANTSAGASEREFEGRSGFAVGDANNGMGLDHVIHLGFDMEETNDSEDEEDGHQPPNGPADLAPLLVLVAPLGTSRSEPGEEAGLGLGGASNNEFLGGFVDAEDGEFASGGLFDGILGHVGNGRHGGGNER